MRVLRVVTSLVDLVVLAVAASILATKLSVPGEGLWWEDSSLILLVTAMLATVVCLRPWSQFRADPPGPMAPFVAVVLNIAFALGLVLTMVRFGEWLSAALLVRALPFVLMLTLNLVALGFRLPARPPAWLWPAAALPTVAWTAFYGWPLTFAGLLFGVRPAG